MTDTDRHRRYNEQHYDRIHLQMPRGAKAVIQQRADLWGVSIAAYITMCVCADLDMMPDEWRRACRAEAADPGSYVDPLVDELPMIASAAGRLVPAAGTEADRRDDRQVLCHCLHCRSWSDPGYRQDDLDEWYQLRHEQGMTDDQIHILLI